METHEQTISLARTGRNERSRGAAGIDRKQIVPAAAHPAGMGLDELAQWNAHSLFDVAGARDMAGNAEELGPGIIRPPDRGEPSRAATADVRYLGDRLDIVDRGWAAVKADIGRERRPPSRLAPPCCHA